MSPREERSIWLIVFARGRTLFAPTPPELPAPLLATEFLRTLLLPETEAPLTLSLLPARGREDVGFVMCNFCWCRNSRSRLAKHLVHSGHSNGFSLVCDRSCRFRCSSLANDLVHVAQTCGRGLSVFGGGNWADPFWLGLPLPLDVGRPGSVSIRKKRSRSRTQPTLVPVLRLSVILSSLGRLTARFHFWMIFSVHTLCKTTTCDTTPLWKRSVVA